MATGIDKCIDDVSGEMKLPRERVAAIAEQLQAVRARLEGKVDPTRVERDLRQHAKTQAEKMRVEAAARRKAGASDALKQAKLDAFHATNAAKGIDDQDIVVATMMDDARMKGSAWLGRVSLRNAWVGDMADAVARRAPAVFKLLELPPAKSKPFFDDVVDELAEMHPAGKPGVTRNKDALEFAGILREFQEATRLERQRHGIVVPAPEGATAPVRLHEGLLLKAGEKQFVLDAIDHLDIEKMYPGTPLFGPEGGEVVQALRDAYYDSIHGRGAAERLEAAGGLTEGSANLKKRAEAERPWRFKDAASWRAFNEKYGRGHVIDGVLSEMDKAARDISLVEKFGSNPQANLRMFLARTQRKLSQAAERGEITDAEAARRTKLLDWEGTIENAYRTVSGRTDIPTDVDWDIGFGRLKTTVKAADAMANIRQGVTLAKLPSSLLAQFPDLVTYAATMQYQGRGVLQGYADALKGLATGGNREVARLLGVGGDAITRDVHVRFAADELKPGVMARAVESMFKWTGARFWTERLERGIASMSSSWMATLSSKGFDALPESYRHLLGLHGVTPEEWAAVRHAVRAVDGEGYVLPGELRKVDGQHFGGLTGAALDRARHDLEMKLRGFFADEAHYAVIKGDDRTKLTMLRGSQAGSVPGEAYRTLLQFSSFGVAYQQRWGGRLLRGYAGADPGKGLMASVPGALRNNGLAIANVVAGSLLFGYLSMSAKDIARNKTPKPLNDYRSWLAAGLQGGGFGIWGDFMFGEADRNGGTLQGKLTGPAVGGATDMLTMFQKVTHGQASWSDLIHLARYNHPVWPVNMWYTKALVDIAILNRLEEWASPGTFGKRAATMKHDTGQRYLVSPLIAQGRYSPRGAWK